MTVRRDLLRALEAAGLSSGPIPPSWDGAQLSAHISAIVEARYPGVELIQARPIAIAAPDGFDYPRFSELLLRVAGLDQSSARTFARQAAPIGFLPVAPDKSVTIRQVSLNAGAGTLVHDLDGAGGPERATLIWSTADRLFVLTADEVDDDRLLSIANAIPSRD